jgi:succinoglycan biosynthesis protein ExoM
MSTGEAYRVTVAVPTFRRPDDLRRILPVLLGQAAAVTAAGGYLVDVLVVDNDPTAGAAPVVAEVGGGAVRYAWERTPGIAAVRNRALDECAGSTVLAFIDDDEHPGEDWLALLLDTWRATGAAVVSGRILAEYAGELDPWIRAGEFFRRRSLATGTEIGTAAAGNLLLDLRQIRDLGVRFETALGLSGGEDTLFSRSLVRAGGRMVWCDEAVAVDQVPSDRMTRRWVLTRAWSHGNATVLTELRLAERPSERVGIRVRGLVRGLARLGGGGLRWAFGLLGASRRHQARGLRTVLRGAGMLGGVCGIEYREYARPGERRWHWMGGVAA